MKIHEKGVKICGKVVRVAQLEGDKYTFPDDPEDFVKILKTSRKRVDIFTFMQRLPESQPKFQYAYEMDNLAVLPITTFEYWWDKQIRSYPRNRARQAGKRGVIMREVPYGDELVKGICGIYNETPVRQGKKFPHYGMTMQRGREYAGTFLDRSIYVGAYLEEEMIGFIKLSIDESRTQAALVHILSMAKHKDKAPTNALISEAVKACAERKVPYLIYEHFNYGNKVGDSLSHFKEVNGFVRMDIPRYYIPMTPLGQLALRWGLHRRLTEWVPESMAAKFREVRKAWYDRRFQASAES